MTSAVQRRKAATVVVIAEAMLKKKKGVTLRKTKLLRKSQSSGSDTDVHEIYTIKYPHIYIFSFTFMLFCD